MNNSEIHSFQKRKIENTKKLLINLDNKKPEEVVTILERMAASVDMAMQNAKDCLLDSGPNVDVLLPKNDFSQQIRLVWVGTYPTGNLANIACKSLIFDMWNDTLRHRTAQALKKIIYATLCEYNNQVFDFGDGNGPREFLNFDSLDLRRDINDDSIDFRDYAKAQQFIGEALEAISKPNTLAPESRPDSSLDNAIRASAKEDIPFSEDGPPLRK